MLNPISTIEDNENSTLYEYRAIYLWVLYGILTVLGIGVVTKEVIVSGTGGVLMLLYFLTISMKYREHGRVMKEATKNGSIEISGNKWSFKNPLRVRIPKK